MKKGIALGILAALAVSGGGQAGPQQKVTPPKASYWLDASTGGFGSMSMGSAMRMAFGGSPGAAKMLELRLGSTLQPSGGSPAATHEIPPGLRMGKSLPLVTPTRERGEPGQPGEIERPRGRLLLFWGCGERAPKGQPVIIDFAKVAQGQFPPGLFSARVRAPGGPTFSSSRTYGDWPNSKSRKDVKSDSSLLGEHLVKGNYTPDIRFTLTKNFMEELRLSQSGLPSGAARLSWNGVTGANGYYAMFMGSNGQENGDIVWWSSSSAREFAGALHDFVPPAEVARLVREKVVMPASQRECAVPAEALKAAPMGMASVIGYGDEENIIWPPRPADPKITWEQDGAVKLRRKTMGAAMLGAGAQAQNCPESASETAGGVLGGGLGRAVGGLFGKKKDKPEGCP